VKRWVEENKLRGHRETSAKENIGVKELFEEVAPLAIEWKRQKANLATKQERGKAARCVVM
jgi:uncharacterized small protein (DUF1192 family)